MRPAARNSMWRFGFGTPINYSDNEVFCGGVGSKLTVYFSFTKGPFTYYVSTLRGVKKFPKCAYL